MEHKEFLIRAIRLAEDGIKNGGGPFGAVIVLNGEIISEANNRVVISNNPTAHAEILAIQQASKVLGTHILADCTLYASCEPCPMCTGAIWWANIKRLVYGISLKESSKLFGKEIDITSKYINKKGGNKINIQEGILKKEIKTLYNI